MSKEGSIFNKLFGGSTVSKPELKYGADLAWMELSEKQQKEHDLMLATHEMLEGLARDAIADEFRKQDEILAQHKADHESDVAAYAFECKRHGDFLTLFVTRSVHVRTYERGGYKTALEVKKHSTSINLGACNQIYLTEGYAPDRDGAGRFEYVILNDSGEQPRQRSYDGNSPAPDGYKYMVHAKAFEQFERPLFSELGSCNESGRIINWYYGSRWDPYRIKTEITNAARAAKDDKIHFSGLGTLYAPAGIGKAVHERILAELEKVSA